MGRWPSGGMRGRSPWRRHRFSSAFPISVPNTGYGHDQRWLQAACGAPDAALFRAGTVARLSEWHLVERFASCHDEAAFEALVARFGPMILGVCRRMLRDDADVADAFQTTFLVLVRQAPGAAPGPATRWGRGFTASPTAWRSAPAAGPPGGGITNGRADAPNPPRSAQDPAGFEVAAVLDAELSRLPAKYRAPIVLCYFEGLTHEEAALRLGWPVGTVKGRLVRARDRLLHPSRPGAALHTAGRGTCRVAFAAKRRPPSFPIPWSPVPSGPHSHSKPPPAPPPLRPPLHPWPHSPKEGSLRCSSPRGRSPPSPCSPLASARGCSPIRRIPEPGLKGHRCNDPRPRPARSRTRVRPSPPPPTRRITISARSIKR